jgi:hypothetical protein
VSRNTIRGFKSKKRRLRKKAAKEYARRNPVRGHLHNMRNPGVWPMQPGPSEEQLYGKLETK